MAIYVITGKPGAFKTAFFMETALEIIKEGRLTVFSNVRGLKAEKYALNTMEHFKDWVDYPEGTCFFIDEVQEFTRDVPTAAKTEDLPTWFTLLEKHRHKGYDFYLTTQHPMFIHTHLRRLVEKHFHMQRAEGLPFSNKRMWQQICNEPEDIKNASLKMGCTTTIYRPPKKVFDYYESTVLDTHKFKVPTKLLRYGAILAVLFGFAFYMGKPVFERYINFSDKKTTTASVSPSDSEVQKQLADAKKEQLDREQAAQMGLTYEQYKDLKNPAAYNQQAAQLNVPQPEVHYDPNHPYDAQLVNYKYQATSAPRFSGCIKYGNRYVAYTEQGTILKNVPQSDCRRLIENGDRPYNYLASNNSQGFSDRSVSSHSRSSANSVLPVSNVSTGDGVSQNVRVSEDQLDSIGKPVVGVLDHHPFFPEKDITKPSSPS